MPAIRGLLFYEVARQHLKVSKGVVATLATQAPRWQQTSEWEEARRMQSYILIHTYALGPEDYTTLNGPLSWSGEKIPGNNGSLVQQPLPDLD